MQPQFHLEDILMSGHKYPFTFKKPALFDCLVSISTEVVIVLKSETPAQYNVLKLIT